jgi:hypothetical protein
MSRELVIDRLVLDIPGLDPARAVSVAERIAEGLAGRLAGAPVAGAILSVELAPVAGESDERLAARAVDALVDRFG